MKHDFRLASLDRLLQVLGVADVADHRLHTIGDTRQLEQIRRGSRGERGTSHTCTDHLEPQRKPSTLKTCVASNQYGLVLPKIRVQSSSFLAPLSAQRYAGHPFQIFHGGLGESQN